MLFETPWGSFALTGRARARNTVLLMVSLQSARQIAFQLALFTVRASSTQYGVSHCGNHRACAWRTPPRNSKSNGYSAIPIQVDGGVLFFA